MCAIRVQQICSSLSTQLGILSHTCSPLPSLLPSPLPSLLPSLPQELKISYPCVMLNVMVADHNTNPQYQTLVDPVTKV